MSELTFNQVDQTVLNSLKPPGKSYWALIALLYAGLIFDRYNERRYGILTIRGGQTTQEAKGCGKTGEFHCSCHVANYPQLSVHDNGRR